MLQNRVTGRVDLSEALFSLVIPVYHSADFIEQTVERCRAAMQNAGRRYEIILVNDGSRDASWQKIESLAYKYPEVTAIDLIYNYGQHTANYCGLAVAQGDFVITLDDDLQNPPEEIEKLVAAAERGHDLVVGRFLQKKHGWKRRLGSWLMGQLNQRIFRSPRGFVHTNFRLIERSIVDRVLKFHTHYPYTSGLAVMFARDPVNVPVDHHKRVVGESNYTMRHLMILALRIIFSYSKLPMRLISFIGLGISFALTLISIGYLLQGLLFGSQVQGWVSIVLLLSITMSLLFFIQAVIGEYLGRILLHLNQPEPYHIHTIVRGQPPGPRGRHSLTVPAELPRRSLHG